MTPVDGTPLDDALLSALLAEDEALAAGPPADETGLRECLRLLEAVWPRHDPGRAGAAVDDSAEPWTLGRFSVLRELGRGGFGIVYLAHDPVLGRRVALKVPSPEALLSGDLRGRFLREARVVGGLDHPGIVPVFEAAEDGLLCYIASAYCDGPTLSAWLRARPGAVPARVAARLVAAMADAVLHAHLRGVLHCDIKPSNVLLQPPAGPGPFGPDDLVPRLTDFGLARFLVNAQPGDATRSGVPTGSPPYMAPEQAAGRNREIGPAADVYALGATLYELLTGRPPFRGETLTETLRLVIDTDAVAPRTLRPGLPRDLETVCLKCLEKDPARRYPSASALADDLNRFLDGLPVRARPAPVWERAVKWARRHPASAAAAAFALALAAGLAGVGAWSNAWLREHNARLQKEARRADFNARLADRHLESAQFRLAHRAVDLGQFERAQEILDDIRPGTSGAGRRGFVPGYLRREATREVVVLTHKALWQPAYVQSHDRGTVASYDQGGQILLWDAAGWRPGVAVRAPEPIERPLALSPDGQLMAALEMEQPLRKPRRPRRAWVWETASGRLAAEVEPAAGETFACLSLLANGRLLLESTRPPAPGRVARVHDPADPAATPVVVGEGVTSITPSADGTLLIVRRAGDEFLHDAATGGLVKKLTGGPAAVSGLTRDNGTLVTLAGNPVRATVRGAKDGCLLGTLELGGMPAQFQTSPDASVLAGVSPEGVVTLWGRDPVRTATIRPDDLDRKRDVEMALSPDGSALALSSYGLPGGAYPVTLWDTATGAKKGTFPGRRAGVRFLGFLPGGRSLFIGGTGWASVWRLGPPADPAQPAGHTDEAWSAAYSPDGRTLATGSDDTDEPQTLKLWDPATGRLRRSWKPHAATVAAVAFHPSGDRIATASLNETENLRLWETTGRLVAELAGHTAMVRTVAFSPDGRVLASAGSDKVIRLWDGDDGSPLGELSGHTDTVRKIAFSPDGRTLVSAGNDGMLRLWNLSSRTPVWAVRGPTMFSAVAFTPNGRTVATADEHGVVMLWDPADGKQRLAIRGNDASLRCLAISPDGRTLAAAGDGRTVRLWDLATGQELLALEGHGHWVNALAFSPDGLTLASVSHDGAVKLWRGGEADD